MDSINFPYPQQTSSLTSEVPTPSASDLFSSLLSTPSTASTNGYDHSTPISSTNSTPIKPRTGGSLKRSSVDEFQTSPDTLDLLNSKNLKKRKSSEDSKIRSGTPPRNNFEIIVPPSPSKFAHLPRPSLTEDEIANLSTPMPSHGKIVAEAPDSKGTYLVPISSFGKNRRPVQTRIL